MIEKPPLWRNILAEGTAVARALNDIDTEGYECAQVIHCGMRPVENKLQNTVTLIPLFLILARRRFGLVPELVAEDA